MVRPVLSKTPDYWVGFREMITGTTAACLVFGIAVVALMITDDKQWLYLGFCISVVLVVVQMIKDKRASYKEPSDP